MNYTFYEDITETGGTTKTFDRGKGFDFSFVFT